MNMPCAMDVHVQPLLEAVGLLLLRLLKRSVLNAIRSVHNVQPKKKLAMQRKAELA